jgi:hypothetical protein
METIILVLAIGFMLAFVVLSLMMVHQVAKRGVKINILWLRLFIIKYLHQYRKITLEETGKVGPLFYPCLASVNIALVLAVIGMILYL